MESLQDMLIRHEGLSYKMYKDSLGIETIGVGHNLRDKPLTRRAVMLILEDDIEDATNSLRVALPWTNTLDWPRRSVLIDMCFNLGINGLLKFKNTLMAIQEGRWEDAHNAMLNSLWAKQVGKRAIELADVMLTGEFHDDT